VHKSPALDVVGWFALVPVSGPVRELLPFQRYIAGLNETNILLAIHPTAFEKAQTADQKLPITVYESVRELDPARDDGQMDIDRDESSDLKFRPVPFTIETDEAEMIAINFVSKGAGSAAAVSDAPAVSNQSASQPPVEDVKGKKKAAVEPAPSPAATLADAEILTVEEQDQIAALTTRLNSVKMLKSRIDTLASFVKQQQPSYLTNASIPLSPTSPDPASLPHLRSIQALITRLALLTPPASSNLESAAASQSNDVKLSQLLSTLNHEVQGMQQLGKTFSVVENARANRRNTSGSNLPFDPNAPSMGGSSSGFFPAPAGRGGMRGG
jgi:COP9 signalosome complex subunit 6